MQTASDANPATLLPGDGSLRRSHRQSWRSSTPLALRSPGTSSLEAWLASRTEEIAAPSYSRQHQENQARLEDEQPEDHGRARQQPIDHILGGVTTAAIFAASFGLLATWFM